MTNSNYIYHLERKNNSWKKITFTTYLDAFEFIQYNALHSVGILYKIRIKQLTFSQKYIAFNTQANIFLNNSSFRNIDPINIIANTRSELYLNLRILLKSKQIRKARKDDFLSFYGFKEKAELLKLEIGTFLKKQALKNLIT